jgi:hypothetical protein
MNGGDPKKVADALLLFLSGEASINGSGNFEDRRRLIHATCLPPSRKPFAEVPTLTEAQRRLASCEVRLPPQTKISRVRCRRFQEAQLIIEAVDRHALGDAVAIAGIQEFYAVNGQKCYEALPTGVLGAISNRAP